MTLFSFYVKYSFEKLINERWILILMGRMKKTAKIIWLVRAALRSKPISWFWCHAWPSYSTAYACILWRVRYTPASRCLPETRDHCFYSDKDAEDHTGKVTYPRPHYWSKGIESNFLLHWTKLAGVSLEKRTQDLYHNSICLLVQNQ